MRHRRLYNVPALLIGLCALLFVAVKAGMCSFTHDESLGYANYVHQSFMEIVSYATPYTNNHILNTLMMKLWDHFLGTAEWALRLHSILAFAGYLFFGSRILRKFLPAALILPGFVILIANPYLLDFWGLARGYGLSICFMMAAVWYFICALQTRKIVQLALFNVACLLACCSNFSLINFYLSALGAFYLVCLLERAMENRKVWNRYLLWASVVNFLLVLATTLILWEPLRKTREAGVLDFGGKAGFVADTVASIVRASFYHIAAPDMLVYVLSWMIVAVVFATAVYWIRSVATDRSSIVRLRALVIVNSTLIGVAVLVISQHFLLHNDYFVGRFALFMLPLFMINMLLWLGDLYQNVASTKRITGLAVPMLAGLVVLNTLFNLNTHSYLDWDYDKDTKQVIGLLKAHHDRVIPGKPVRLGATWHFEPTANFYRRLWKMDWLQQVDRDDAKLTDGY